MPFTREHFKSLIKVALEHKASDIHIRTGETPCLRIRGELVPVQTKNFEPTDVMDIIKILLADQERFRKLGQLNEMDGAYEVDNLCRLRYNVFRYDQKLGVILRIVNTKIPTVQELGLNPVLHKIAQQQRGLILVTGPTGSGKSTTLAAMVNYINQNRRCHIITVEDPIEYRHSQIKARISQREIGADTLNFNEALRSALRQDPDVILIGEMRDPETVSIALKAAETGHVVYSTVHTTNAVATIGRIISMFPPAEQEDVQKRLAENLYATIGQRLLKGTEKGKIVIAQEIMISTPGVKECIRGEEPLSRIYDIIIQGSGKAGNGSQSFDQHIMDLYQSGQISKETALDAVSSQSDFFQKLIVE